jgi:hypothetical protein
MEGNKMSKQPTPETDAEAEKLDFKVDLNFARKLERERDEARKAAAKWEAIALREASINGSQIFGEEDAK